eukprot:scaffold10399_cov94-Isochrysis_galbana.AAC.2
MHIVIRGAPYTQGWGAKAWLADADVLLAAAARSAGGRHAHKGPDDEDAHAVHEKSKPDRPLAGKRLPPGGATRHAQLNHSRGAGELRLEPQHEKDRDREDEDADPAEGVHRDEPPLDARIVRAGVPSDELGEGERRVAKDEVDGDPRYDGVEHKSRPVVLAHPADFAAGPFSEEPVQVLAACKLLRVAHHLRRRFYLDEDRGSVLGPAVLGGAPVLLLLGLGFRRLLGRGRLAFHLDNGHAGRGLQHPLDYHELDWESGPSRSHHEAPLTGEGHLPGGVGRVEQVEE